MQARVLIVDDNRAVRAALRHVLQDDGNWEIIEAEDGQVGIARAVELRPDVIILDLVMPVMDGLNAAREISRVLPETPIVMYTMHWSPMLEIEAQKVGVRKLVSKSQSSVLRSVVQEFLAAAPAKSDPKATSPAAPVRLAPDPALASSADPTPTAASGDPSPPPDTKLAS